uniref:Gamma-glutamyltransferase n=1 Tax=Paraburkholderia sprentiae WSM5005 TaxID=754502 RepID=A0A1I9YEZ1_9BURK
MPSEFLNPSRATRGMAVAPHALAAAATIAVVYPHMNSIGGDGFWLISRRWLLGRTWGQSTDTLKLEARFAPDTVARLVALGHDVETMQAL